MAEEPGNVSIGQFLTQLAENPELVEAYVDNPERAMQEAGLSEEDRDLILSGNIDQIRQAVQQDFAGATVALMVWFPIIRPQMVW